MRSVRPGAPPLPAARVALETHPRRPSGNSTSVRPPRRRTAITREFQHKGETGIPAPARERASTMREVTRCRARRAQTAARARLARTRPQLRTHPRYPSARLRTRSQRPESAAARTSTTSPSSSWLRISLAWSGCRRRSSSGIETTPQGGPRRFIPRPASAARSGRTLRGPRIRTGGAADDIPRPRADRRPRREDGSRSDRVART